MPTSTLVLVKNKTINCAYVIFDLSWWKIQYPKKSLCCFRDPKKSRRLSQTQKKSLLAKMSEPKKSFGPPSLKYVSGAPGYRINYPEISLYFRFAWKITFRRARRNEMRAWYKPLTKWLPPTFLIDWHLPNQSIRITSVACFSSMQIFHAWEK